CDWPQNVHCQHRQSADPGGDRLHHDNRTAVATDELEPETTEPSSVDETGNDLDSPQFDESIASFVDQNGDVCVHDGPGAMYALMQRSATISDHEQEPIYRRSEVNSIEKVRVRREWWPIISEQSPI